MYEKAPATSGWIFWLVEAALDIVGMDDDASSEVCDTEVVNAGVEPLFHIAEGAVELHVLGTGCHHVDRDGVLSVAEFGITDLSALLFFYLVVVWGTNMRWGI